MGRSWQWLQLSVVSGILAVTLVFALPAWVFRHEIRGLVHGLSLPRVEAAPGGALRFAVIGDYGSGSMRAREVALMIESWSPDLIATVGDNNYPVGAAETIDSNVGRLYHAYLAPYRGRYGKGGTQNRFFPAPGHRDWDTGALQPYLDYFSPPGNGRYYDFVRGPVHFFMLDTDEREPDGATADSVQGRWLQRRLAESTARWKLVFAHHAPYTSHREEDVVRMRWPFREWGADAVFSGFYHVYERLEVDGLPYFVNGAGGSWLSGFGETDPRSRFRSWDRYGALIADATAARLEVRFVDGDGGIVDHLVLTKGS